MLYASVLPSFPQPAGRTRWAACLGMVSLLVLGGCTRLQVKLGWKMHLDKVPITSMQASLPKGPGIAPGQRSRRWWWC